MRAIEMPRLEAKVTERDIFSIAEIMTKQEMLHSKIDASKVLFK